MGNAILLMFVAFVIVFLAARIYYYNLYEYSLLFVPSLLAAVLIGVFSLATSADSVIGELDKRTPPKGIYSVVSSTQIKEGYAVTTRMDSGDNNVHLYLLKMDPPKRFKSSGLEREDAIQPYP